MPSLVLNYFGQVLSSCSTTPSEARHFWRGTTWCPNRCSRPAFDGIACVFLALVFRESSRLAAASATGSETDSTHVTHSHREHPPTHRSGYRLSLIHI